MDLKNMQSFGYDSHSRFNSQNSDRNQQENYNINQYKVKLDQSYQNYSKSLNDKFDNVKELKKYVNVKDNHESKYNSELNNIHINKDHEISNEYFKDVTQSNRNPNITNDLNDSYQPINTQKSNFNDKYIKELHYDNYNLKSKIKEIEKEKTSISQTYDRQYIFQLKESNMKNEQLEAKNKVLQEENKNLKNTITKIYEMIGDLNFLKINKASFFSEPNENKIASFVSAPLNNNTIFNDSTIEITRNDNSETNFDKTLRELRHSDSANRDEFSKKMYNSSYRNDEHNYVHYDNNKDLKLSVEDYDMRSPQNQPNAIHQYKRQRDLQNSNSYTRNANSNYDNNNSNRIYADSRHESLELRNHSSGASYKDKINWAKNEMNSHKKSVDIGSGKRKKVKRSLDFNLTTNEFPMKNFVKSLKVGKPASSYMSRILNSSKGYMTKK